MVIWLPDHQVQTFPYLVSRRAKFTTPVHRLLHAFDTNELVEDPLIGNQISLCATIMRQLFFFLVNMILYAHWRTSSRCQATLPHHLRRWWMQGPHNRRSGCPSTITNERFLLQNESNQCTFVVYSFGNETMFFFRFPWSKYILWDFESYYTHWKDLKPPATSSCGEGSHRSRDCGSQSETQNRFSLIVPTEHKFPRKFDSWSTFHVRYLQYLTLRTDSPSCCQSSVLKLFFCFTGVLRLRIRWPRKIRLSRFVSTSARP